MDPTNQNPQPKDDAAQKAADLVRQQIHSLYPNQPKSNHQARPDPNTDRDAYNKWYYAQTPEAQQAEWDKYYSISGKDTLAQHTATDHAVSEHYAHEHIVPEQQFETLSLASVGQAVKETKAATPSEEQAIVYSSTPEVATTTPDANNASAHITSVQDAKSAFAKRRNKQQKEPKKKSNFRSLLTASMIALVISFVFYNEIVIGQVRQFVSPASTVSTPVILDPSADIAVGNESRIIIPKINVDVPVVYDVTSYDETEIQNALERGVVHYGETALPGEIGNNVIVGHSSNNFFNSGKYKFAFVLLDRLEEGDTFILHEQGVRYVYRVSNKQVIEPDDFSLVQPTAVPTTTLITCTPPGTSWRRLVIQGEQISPSIETASKAAPTTLPADQAKPVPGNAPSLWQQITNIF